MLHRVNLDKAQADKQSVNKSLRVNICAFFVWILIKM